MKIKLQIRTIIKKATELWRSQVPEAGSYTYEKIEQLFNECETELIEETFKTLQEDYKYNIFPSFYDWKKAFDHTVSMRAYKALSNEKLSLIKVEDRKIYRYEKESIDLIRSWDEKKIIVEAKLENWYGYIYKNYAVAPFGLVNYLDILVRLQICILNKITCNYMVPEELDSRDFTNWIRSDYFKSSIIGNKVISLIYREEDIKQIRAKRIYQNELYAQQKDIRKK